jgi:uncharacterized protein (DUF362 family)
MTDRINRREFMKKGAAAALGAGLAVQAGWGRNAARADAGAGRVIEVYRSGAVAAGRTVDADAVREMVRRGMAALTGAKNPWAEFIKPGDRVGLKVNTLGRPLLFTHHELIRAVADDIVTLGVPPKNIIVWDRFEDQMRDCQFTFNTTDESIYLCYGTEALDEANNRFDSELTYVSELDNPRQRAGDSTASRFSRIFSRECDKVVNLAVLKDHGMSGVTLCLKNLAYGLCDNNRRFHGPTTIGPFIAGFNAHPEVRRKVVLHMIDGLEACYDQGPAPRNPRAIWSADTLWLGTDPVALDAVGFKAIDDKRRAEGIAALRETGRPCDHIELAAARGVGIADLGRIKVERVVIG